MSGSDGRRNVCPAVGLVITPKLDASLFIHASLMLGPQMKDLIMGWRHHLRNCLLTQVSLCKQSPVLYLS